ncbi:MAG: cytochrome c maturation protein CcmE [Pseudomonadota bacterium]
MHPQRKNRLTMIGFLLVGVSLTAVLVFNAIGRNMNLFYPPAEVVSGVAPLATQIRAGGMVKDGSVTRNDSNDLAVEFVVTDHAGSEFTVRYTGILPDLFREGQGILVQGQLTEPRLFVASEVLAKHDETYMPPELAEMASADTTIEGADGS